ncbi:hypothetical protein ACFO0N_15110 [Halobium salinum]|uniref:Uncharacterized protein n=1 Tax=Halobium salinum TaxID=1364940 RepID=A0ABD5PEI6_9EURY|nr:hypothetical protein [Halobium salinum]
MQIAEAMFQTQLLPVTENGFLPEILVTLGIHGFAGFAGMLLVYGAMERHYGLGVLTAVLGIGVFGFGEYWHLQNPPPVVYDLVQHPEVYMIISFCGVLLGVFTVFLAVEPEFSRHTPEKPSDSEINL